MERSEPRTKRHETHALCAGVAEAMVAAAAARRLERAAQVELAAAAARLGGGDQAITSRRSRYSRAPRLEPARNAAVERRHQERRDEEPVQQLTRGTPSPARSSSTKNSIRLPQRSVSGRRRTRAAVESKSSRASRKSEWSPSWSAVRIAPALVRRPQRPRERRGAAPARSRAPRDSCCSDGLGEAGRNIEERPVFCTTS